MERELVDYSDLDAPNVTDEMYVSNLVYQYPHLDPELPVETLEWIIDHGGVPDSLDPVSPGTDMRK
jgi:hypothetical protein